MKFLKSRAVALCLLAVVVCTSTISNAREGLEELARDTKNAFYYSDTGYKSTYERLQDRSDAASNLVTLGNTYHLTETEALKFAQEELGELIDWYSSDAEDYYQANNDLTEPFNTLYDALMQQPLTDREKQMAESYRTTFEGAQRQINADDYNEKVREFNQTVDRFPANVFLKMTYIDEPEYFGPEDMSQNLLQEVGPATQS